MGNYRLERKKRASGELAHTVSAADKALALQKHATSHGKTAKVETAQELLNLLKPDAWIGRFNKRINRPKRKKRPGVTHAINQDKPLKLKKPAVAIIPTKGKAHLNRRVEPMPDGFKQTLTKKQFVQLQKEWYKRLKKEGFFDIEHFNEAGNISIFTLDYSQGMIKKRYSVDKLKHDHSFLVFYYHASKKFMQDTFGERASLYRTISYMLGQGHNVAEVCRYLQRYSHRYTDGRLKSFSEVWASQQLPKFYDIVSKWNHENPAGVYYEMEEPESTSKFKY